MAQVEVLHFGAGAAGFELTFGPCPAYGQDGGAVGAAVAGKVGQARFKRALADGLDPLRGSSIVAEVVAGRDRLAEHKGGGHGRQLAGDRGGHGFVEHRRSLTDAAEPRQHRALVGAGERLQAPISEPSPDRDCFAGLVEGPVVVAFSQQDHGRRPCKITLLEAFGLFLEQPARASEPAGGDGHVQLAGVLENERETGARRPAAIACFEEADIGALAGTYGVVEVAAPVGGIGEPVQVRGRKPFAGVGGGEKLERLLPCPTRERVPTGSELPGSGPGRLLRRAR